MTPLSKRYQPHLVLLMFLTVIPIAIHSYAKIRSDDCVDLKRLGNEAGFSTPTPARSKSLLSLYDAEQFWEGDIKLQSAGTSLKYVVIRAYNAKRLYHRPEQRYSKETEPVSRGIEWASIDGDRIPIHRVFRAASGARKEVYVIAYLLIYEGDTVENPYIAQLLHAPSQLIHGSRPMTLFMVFGLVGASDFKLAEDRAREWLVSAWQRYQEACGS